MNEREVFKLMKKNGYMLQPNRGKGSHHYFTNGKQCICIPNSFNRMVIRRLIKQYKLSE